jgi:renalase
MNIAIVGAGIAGLACAGDLVAAGHTVTLFDKGRGAGGRMSTRRISTPQGDAYFDHGAQYFTCHDPQFLLQVMEWQALGVAARWPAAGDEAWVGTPSMNVSVKTMAQNHNVQWSASVDAILPHADGWQLVGDTIPTMHVDHVVIATPAEQAVSLLLPLDAAMAACASSTRSLPCWTLMLAFTGPLPTTIKACRTQNSIGWAACNSDKPKRTGLHSWVVQASPAWSAAHMEDTADAVLDYLTASFAEVLSIVLPVPVSATVHRWRYATSGRAGEGCLYDAHKGIGVCGDWLIGPRVESAWLSGKQLAAKIIAA